MRNARLWPNREKERMTKGTRLKFFIVEDDPDVVDFVRSLLEEDGHAVTASMNSASALTDIVEQKPDCVLKSGVFG